jgi:pyruvate formate lyase activating enzyme
MGEGLGEKAPISRMNVPTGLISYIQKYSLQDGPGIRTTVFLKGCPLRCAWCHNPENISADPQVIVFKEKCVRCGACRKVCPQQNRSAVTRTARPWSNAEPGRCLVCGACVEVCPSGARTLVGRRMPLPDLVRELLRDRIFYDESHGGVTFSGGEPTAQMSFLEAALLECKQRGVHTAVDTCGLAPQDKLLGLAPLVDLFLYDLKLMNEARHREFCGASNRLILENLRALAESSARIWVRVPVIPGVNDRPEETAAMAKFIASLRHVPPVNLLPYHRIGLHKFERLAQPYPLSEIAPPSPEQMEAVAARFRAANVDVQLGG